ncbi:TMV resistance protein N [Trifolium medium]|uniref:TMV resistance protein N n=1 Tax=Trifolium medium TaxID=97028 RepID=A0A392RC82_9FABA|nr:TMV resistance protein N [Trifolium medium]
MSLSLNGYQGKWKAYIVPMDVPVSEKYMMETAIIKGQERLGRLGCNFKKTAYGKLRVEVDAKCGNITMQDELKVEHYDQNELRIEHYAQNELRVDHYAKNQKQHELGGQSQITDKKQKTKKSLIRQIGCCCCD